MSHGRKDKEPSAFMVLLMLLFLAVLILSAVGVIAWVAYYVIRCLMGLPAPRWSGCGTLGELCILIPLGVVCAPVILVLWFREKWRERRQISELRTPDIARNPSPPLIAANSSSFQVSARHEDSATISDGRTEGSNEVRPVPSLELGNCPAILVDPPAVMNPGSERSNSEARKVTLFGADGRVVFHEDVADLPKGIVH